MAEQFNLVLFLGMPQFRFQGTTLVGVGMGSNLIHIHFADIIWADKSL